MKNWDSTCFRLTASLTERCTLIVNIVYDRGSEEDKRKAVAAIRKMTDECAKAGHGEYILLADQVAYSYGWNKQAMLKFHETIKDSLDPNGILALGRNGISRTDTEKPEDLIQTPSLMTASATYGMNLLFR